MSHEITSLSVLFLGKKRPENEIIRQRLTDGLHCSVFSDTAPYFSDYVKSIASKKYDVVLAEYEPSSFFSTPVFIRSVLTSGMGIIYQVGTHETGVIQALINEGASGYFMIDDPAGLLSAADEALKCCRFPSQEYNGPVCSDNELATQEILDNLVDCFYVVDAEWHITYINSKAESCWGCRREELLGRDFWECFPNLKGSSERAMHDIAMKERIPQQWETSSPDSQSWADIRVFPLQDGSLAVFFSDITDKKHAEEVLRLSRDRQAVMLRLSDSLRLLLNPGEIHEAAARIIGEYLGVEKAFYCDVVSVDGVEYFMLEKLYSATDTNILTGLHPIDSPGVLAWENFEGRNIVVCDMETDPRIDDSIRPSLRDFRLGAWVSVPLIRNGRFAASFTVHQPTPRIWTSEEISLIEETTARTWAEVDRVRAETALRKSERHALQLVSELENADRSKNEFINALSHELRNPLAAVTASLSMLDLLDSSQEAKKVKMIIKRQTEQLCRLVDDLLDLTRITNNKVHLNLEPFDLSELTQSSAYDHRTLFEEKGIELVTEIGAAPLYINADPVRISQIIGNLLHNACKFTEKGGSVILSVNRCDSAAVIAVKDTGIGIISSFLPDLFKTFKQADQKKGGLGLGLSIVKGMVELHKGTVEAHSEGLDCGATFTVKLPLLSNPYHTEADDMKAEEQKKKTLKILLIDDNLDLAETTGALLTLYGYNVRTAGTGMSGIQTAREFLPHVIICDIGLPDIDGYEVARRLSGDSEFGNVSLISLSGYTQASDYALSRGAGFSLHISKPVDFDNLRRILDSINLID
ncbi:MAG: response regulator [Clostridiales bacterium]|nr:response regulator [Clostridiales bacterium]